MITIRHTNLVDCDPLLVEATRHAERTMRLFDEAGDLPSIERLGDSRIRTPIEDSRYGYPRNPPSMGGK